MIYNDIYEAKFLNRPNRFIAEILLNNQKEIAHVKNTGRCKELLLKNTKIYVQKSNSEKRKTKWSLISVVKNDQIINIDSQIPNKVFEEGIKNKKIKIDALTDLKLLKREKTFENSRFDFYYESSKKTGFIEIKGVTLEEDGIGKFPDAPTVRGTKHLTELIKATNKGFQCYVIFVIQMKKIKYFTPNTIRDIKFSNELKLAKNNGVKILAIDCNVGENYIELNEFIKVKL